MRSECEEIEFGDSIVSIRETALEFRYGLPTFDMQLG